MRFGDIKGDEMREKVFPAILEEACRQWCAFIEEAPERKDGEGFADFFYEVFEAKEQEYIYEAYCKEQEEKKNQPEEKGRGR